MIPGPIQPDDEVMGVMGSPVQAHYGHEWRDIYNYTIGMLKRVFNTQGDVHLMVGSGSTAIDTCIGSAFSTGEKIIIGVNGFFGERLCHIAAGYGLAVIRVECEWGKPMKPDQFETALTRYPDASGVAVVHLETSTTIVNPIQEIGQIVQQHDKLYMVDAVSSLGGMPLRMDEWGIDLCASASQKCLGAPPGLGPVAIGPRGWDYIDRNPEKGHGWYCNLRTWRQYSIEWGDWHPFPVTHATNNVMALKTSLERLLEEGIEIRMERYQQMALYLRQGLIEIGMPPFTPENLMAPVITAAYGPPGVPTSEIVDYLAEIHRIKIAGGLGALKNKVFRIGHMSPTVSKHDLNLVLNALAEFNH